MTVEDEIELQRVVRAHQSTLGCPEMKRRAHLVAQANALIGMLARKISMAIEDDDAVTHGRGCRAFDRAMVRAERRERAYYVRFPIRLVK